MFTAVISGRPIKGSMSTNANRLPQNILSAGASLSHLRMKTFIAP